MIAPNIERRLANCPNLPTLPGVAVRVIELGRDPDIDATEVARMVSMDPALSAKLLRIANSPMYAMRRRVENLRQALMLIGLNAALTLALSFSLVSRLQQQKSRSIDHARYWRRSLLGGIAARAAGEALQLRGQEELFLAGLLQDIGILVLDTALGEEYGRLASVPLTDDELLREERRVLQTDHAEVGAWLLERWELAEPLCEAVRESHARELPGVKDREFDAFRRCVNLSGRIADVWLASDHEAASREAAAAASRLFGMRREAVGAILARVGRAVPETAALFEVELVTPGDLAAVLQQAQEVLMIRNLKMIEEVTRARHKADQLESRARAAEHRSRTDGLTGVYNRTHLDEVLQDEFDAASEQGWPLCVAFLDLDNFKDINDTHGHQVGDEALRAVGTLLQSQLREHDIVARYGGEEFMVILPGSRTEGACVVLERLREAIAGQPLTHTSGKPVYATISIGLACHMDGVRYATVEDLVRCADRALYGAKRGGRNRLVIYQTDC